MNNLKLYAVCDTYNGVNADEIFERLTPFLKEKGFLRYLTVKWYIFLINRICVMSGKRIIFCNNQFYRRESVNVDNIFNVRMVYSYHIINTPRDIVRFYVKNVKRKYNTDMQLAYNDIQRYIYILVCNDIYNIYNIFFKTLQNEYTNYLNGDYKCMLCNCQQTKKHTMYIELKCYDICDVLYDIYLKIEKTLQSKFTN